LGGLNNILAHSEKGCSLERKRKRAHIQRRSGGKGEAEEVKEGEEEAFSEACKMGKWQACELGQPVWGQFPPVLLLGHWPSMEQAVVPLERETKLRYI